MSFIATCLGGPLIRRLLSGWWDSYKARHADDPLPMKQRGGRWQPAGFIRGVERGIDWIAYFGIACVALGIVGAIYGFTN